MTSLLSGVFGAGFVVGASVYIAAQLPPSTQRQEIQRVTEEGALAKAEELARLAMSNTGVLHPSAEATFQSLGEAVRRWKSESDSGAAPLLAEGVCSTA